MPHSRYNFSPQKLWQAEDPFSELCLVEELWVADVPWTLSYVEQEDKRAEPIALTLEAAFPLPTHGPCWSYQLLTRLAAVGKGRLEQQNQLDRCVLEVL